MVNYIAHEERDAEIKKLFGEMLAQRRKDKDWTQAELANEIGLDNPQTISNWEKGRYTPTSFETAMKLADRLDCDLDYLIGRLPEPTHDIQFIHDQTGLTGEAVRKLQENRGLSFVLSLLIEQNDFIPLLWNIEQKLLQDLTDQETDQDIRDLTAFQISKYLMRILEDVSPDDFNERLSEATEKQYPVKLNSEGDD